MPFGAAFWGVHCKDCKDNLNSHTTCQVNLMTWLRSVTLWSMLERDIYPMVIGIHIPIKRSGINDHKQTRVKWYFRIQFPPEKEPLWHCLMVDTPVFPYQNYRRSWLGCVRHKTSRKRLTYRAARKFHRPTDQALRLRMSPTKVPKNNIITIIVYLGKLL